MAGKKCPIYTTVFSTSQLCCLFTKVFTETTAVNRFFFFTKNFFLMHQDIIVITFLKKIIKFKANALQNKFLITLILCSSPKY